MSIKEKVVEYRNLHKELRVLLGVVLGEFERVEKAPKRINKEISDDECINVIKKLIASNIECGEIEENVILEQFLPQQLSTSDIENIIKYNDFHSIGECMKYFKLFHAGLYDGTQVSKLYNKK